MEVVLTSELERLVREKVASGPYGSPGEVARKALWLLHGSDEVRRQRPEELRAEITIGGEEADRGELVPADQVFASLREQQAESESGSRG